MLCVTEFKECNELVARRLKQLYHSERYVSQSFIGCSLSGEPEARWAARSGLRKHANGRGFIKLAMKPRLSHLKLSKYAEPVFRVQVPEWTSGRVSIFGELGNGGGRWSVLQQHELLHGRHRLPIL